MIIRVELSWKLLWRHTKHKAIMIPIGALNGLAGYHWNDWQTWVFMLVSILLIDLSNITFHNYQKETE